MARKIKVESTVEYIGSRGRYGSVLQGERGKVVAIEPSGRIQVDFNDGAGPRRCWPESIKLVA